MDETQQERLRQFLAGRAEIAAGDHLVLRTLRLHARQRQRGWLGVPLVLLGTLGAVGLAGQRRHGPRATSTTAADALPDA
jgi:hypothetical protein